MKIIAALVIVFFGQTRVTVEVPTPAEPQQQATRLVPIPAYYVPVQQQQVVQVPVYVRQVRPHLVEVRGILGVHRGYRVVWR